MKFSIGSPEYLPADAASCPRSL